MQSLAGRTLTAAHRRGKYLWLPLAEDDGTPAGQALVAHLGMSDQLLARAVRSLCTAIDGKRAMADLAQVLVPDAVDWCLVDLLEPPDLVTRVVALGTTGQLDLPLEQGEVVGDVIVRPTSKGV